MAKTYLSSAKYRIVAKFEISGIVDKHDVVGAVFGQSEGLLGASMDLKELQQSGKIGRIEIEPVIINGKTTGALIVPSSIDSVQTSMLAAAIESVDKVGPYDAKFETERIEDTRAEKREKITDRAKELLSKFMQEQTPDIAELREDISAGVRTAQMIEYGADKLPAGPDVDKSEEVILVEGRADVINLLKNGITNVIAMDGAKVPNTVLELAKIKKIVAFVDGDRGGELNARNLKEIANIHAVVRAPDGKEVEELTKKEILQCLKKESDVERAFGNPRTGESRYGDRAPRGDRLPKRGPRTMRDGPSGPRDRRGSGRFNDRGPRDGFRNGGFRNDRGGRFGDRNQFNRPQRPAGFNSFEPGFEQPMPMTESQTNVPQTMPRFTSLQTVHTSATQNTAERDKFRPILSEIKGTLSAKLLDDNHQVVEQSTIKELLIKLKKSKNVSAIVFDGIITKRLVEAASKQGVKTVVGIKLGKVEDAKGMNLIEIKE